jgi:outer membrane protein TolC
MPGRPLNKEALTRQWSRCRICLISPGEIPGGEASGLEVNLAEVELSKSKKDLLLAGREYLDTFLALQGLMGNGPDTSLDMEGELSPGIISLPDKASLEKPLQTKRPDIKAVSIEVDKAKTAIDLARKSAIPNIVLVL